MPIPLQVTFRNMRPSPAARKWIQANFDRLEHLYGRIMSCRVVVQAPHHHHSKGQLYRISVDLKVPGHEIAVNRNPPEHHAHEEINVAIRDAFDAVARRLEDVARQRRGDVKAHEAEPHGRVVRLFLDESYGFIEGSNGDEVYFHAHSVANNGFRRLKVGQDVHYNPELGEKGLQATVVKPAGKHHLVP